MKIIINESQYKLLIENEELDLFRIDSNAVKGEMVWDMLNSVWKLYKKVKGVSGIDLGYPYTLSLGYINNQVSKRLNLDAREGVYNVYKNLVEIDGSIDGSGFEGIDFPLLKKVGGNLSLITTNSTLPNLVEVGGDLKLPYVKSLPNLVKVGGEFNLMFANVKSMSESFPKLKEIGGNLKLQKSKLSKDLDEKYGDDVPIEEIEKEIRKTINIGGYIYL